MKNPLPESSSDLLVKDGKLLMRSVGVYEILRRFSHIIRLTPFKFEDFLAALILSEEQSTLSAEIHISLLRTLIREDRQQQTWLGPQDIRDSVNIYLYLADNSCWPAALKIYLSADPIGNQEILDKLNQHEYKDYPYNTPLEIRLSILEQLCDQFLMSNLARDEIAPASTNGIGTKMCRLCSKSNGSLIPCSTCDALYHIKCTDGTLESNQDSENSDNSQQTFTCTLCRSNNVTGVTDCISENEKSGNYKRHEALGLDKLNRRYWFLVRRLFVVDENEDDVRYYSKPEQLDEIINNLDNSKHEKELNLALKDMIGEIKKQMRITDDLCNEMKDHKKDDANNCQVLGQDGGHRNYTNQYSSSNGSNGKTQLIDRDIFRTLNNKFSFNSVNSFKWFGTVNGQMSHLKLIVKSSILKFEALLPTTFIHPCWKSEKQIWITALNNAQTIQEFAAALAKLESIIKPVLYRASWNDAPGFTQLFRSTVTEREELKKTDRQPRGFERREWFSQDFELSYKLGTMVKFSSKLKPVKHQVWKQKGEEYRLTGLNGWLWMSSTYGSTNARNSNSHKKIEPFDWTAKIASKNKPKPQPGQKIPIPPFLRPRIPPCHNFLTKRSKKRSILILPQLELKRLARTGGQRETKSFSYSAKQNHYIWPYGMTPRPTFRTCWLYRNFTINTIQDISLQLKVLYASIRWEELKVNPPISGQNVITTDESTVTIELIRKRDKLPFVNRSEYFIKKVITPLEQPVKYRKIGGKKSTPSARSGLRARRQSQQDEERGPTTEEIWVPEDQLELWEIKQFDEKIERQNQLLRERAMREEAEKKRKLEEEKRRKFEQEKRRKADEEAKKVKLSLPTSPIVLQTPKPNTVNGINQPRPSTGVTPVLRYFRTEQGQIIRLPASYLQRGTPLILRQVGPGSNQTNTYIIRPQITTIRPASPSPNIQLIRTATPVNIISTTAINTTPNASTNIQASSEPSTPNTTSPSSNKLPMEHASATIQAVTDTINALVTRVAQETTPSATLESN